MKFLVDFFPVILFFVVYKLNGIYAATLVAIAASAAQVAWFRIRHKRTERMHLVTLVLLAVFGGLTLALRDPIFVMWKPTLVNWLFAGAFLGSQFIGEKTLVERMMSQAIEVPRPIWRRLNLAWVGFFMLSGLANLYVVYFGSGFFDAKQALIQATGESEIDLAHCAELFAGIQSSTQLALCEAAHDSEALWVNFKLFGMMGLTIVFVIAQAFYLARHIRDDADQKGDAGSKNETASTQ
jgi:intracellular septation protein